MPTIPPLVRDAPVDRQSSTARPVAARLVRTQRQYASGFNITYAYEPPKPIPRPGPTPESPFDKWRAAAAEVGLPDDGASGAPGAAAGGEVPAPGVAAAPRRRLHSVLLGSTAVMLLGVLGGIGYLVWSGAVPGVLTPSAPVLAQFPAASDAGLVARSAVDGAPARLLPARDAALDVAAPQPAATLRLVPVVPAGPATAVPWAGKPVLTGQPPPASGVPAVTADATPDRLPEPQAPVLAFPATPADAGPAPEQAVAAVPPATASEVGGALSGVAAPAAPAVLPADAPRVEAAAPAPAMAAATVRLPPTPEWAAAPAFDLANLPEAGAPPAAPPAVLASSPTVPEDPAPSANPASPAPVEAARTVTTPGAEAQREVSTTALVQRMSVLAHDLHDDGLRFRTEMTALSGAVQAKASGLEERLKLAEARSASASGVDVGEAQGGLSTSGVGNGGIGSRAGVGVPRVVRGYRVQAGSPGAVVLSEVVAGAERLARRLVMVGDQLPGAGRVMAIVPRGGSWTVRTERGVIE